MDADLTDRPWTVRVLGPVHALRPDGCRVEIAQAKVRCVLAHLALAEGRAVGTDQIVDALWAEDPPRSAVKTLHGYVARLRRTLTPELVSTQGNEYRLNTQIAAVDVTAFLGLAGRAAAQTAAEERVGLLERALALFPGVPLSNAPSDYLNARYGAGLAERRLAVLEDWAQATLELGRGDVVPALLPAVGEHPYRERLWELLITAQERSGQHAAAVDSYQRVDTLFREQLGVEPGEGLQRVHRRMLATRRPEGPSRPADPPAEPPAEPPTDPHSRLERELADALTAAAQGRAGPAARSHVLHGAPGCGKTTVARRVAEAVRWSYPGGVTAISLEDAPPASGGGEVARRLLSRWQLPTALPEAELLFTARQAWMERRCLLIIDDVRPGVRVGELSPAPAQCGVIICGLGTVPPSRQLSRRQVNRFTRAEADAFLRAEVGADRWDAHPAAARQLAELSEGLAVTLRVIAGRLASDAPLSTAELAARLAAPERRLAELAVDGISVAAHLRRAYEWLDPARQRAFRLLGLLKAPGFPLGVAAACLDGTEADVRELLRQLCDCHLLEETSGGAAAGARYRFGSLERLLAQELSRHADPAAERAQAVRRALSAWSRRGVPAPAGPGGRPEGKPAQIKSMSSRRSVR